MPDVEHEAVAGSYPAGEAEVTSREIIAAGERVRIVETGPEDGPAVVLLHGWGASAYNFRAILPALGRAGLRAVAPDLRGHGWSETQVPPGAWTVQSMVGWVEQLLDALHIDRCVLVGQSIGGAVALDAASHLRGRVRALVLLAPIGFTTVGRIAVARALGIRWWHPTARRWMVKLVMRRIYGSRGRWTERDVDEYWTPLRRRGVVSALLQSVREFDFTPRDPRNVHLGHCRLVIRFGELDRLIPHQSATEHANLLRRAEVDVLDGVGHVPAEEVPDEVAALIERVVREAN
jgi:pimeloyl-ACP methyl ester carboxylesterase